ncbi:MAG: glycoside hydrolase family 3 N-terminal domain-containing protein [Chitinophagaceae bacterium]
MSLEEKVAQLRSFHMARPKLTEAVLNNESEMDSLFKNGIGMMNPDFDATAEQTVSRRNALQIFLKTKTRLGIPTLFIDEAHHGLLAPGADVFSTSIAIACSWDTTLIKRVYNYIAAEASAKGTHWVLAPVVDVCRDPRWGRTGETYGEDPFLCGILGSAVVKGYQGSDNGTVMPNHVAATLKHFTGHGQSEGGINQAPANYSERTLREMHMEPFRLCIKYAQPVGIMAAYCEVDGVPAHANPWLLKKVLRKDWNYQGIVVSDWWAIDQLWQKHHVEPDVKSATARAFNAGVTIDLPFGNNYKHLSALVKEGKVSIKDINAAVTYILGVKFRMGLFEQGEVDINRATELKSTSEGRNLAREAAEKSMVLLKNNGNLLPLQKGKYKKIAIVGPCAAVNYLGDYSGIPSHNVSILEGVRNKVGNTAEVLYHKGCELTTNGDTISMYNYQYINTAIFPSPELNRMKIADAVTAVKQADIIIVAVGENEQVSREAGTDRTGDMATLDLLSQQDELVKAMIETGKPVVVYLSHARPYAINYIAEKANAIIDGWFNGEEAGNAFANILFGDVNPSGKLTISIPRSVGQLPIYYNYKPSSKAYDYVTEKNTPLFPFGYGLSYTKYQYSNPSINDRSVTISVTNTGKVHGEEIVQLYIHDKVSSVTRPVKELKGFQKIALNPGETKTVSFTITNDMLKFWDKDMKYVAEPGVFEIMIGPNSNDLQKVNYTLK